MLGEAQQKSKIVGLQGALAIEKNDLLAEFYCDPNQTSAEAITRAKLASKHLTTRKLISTSKHTSRESLRLQKQLNQAKGNSTIKTHRSFT